MNCPCNNSKTYDQCCGRVHDSIFSAKCAEELMRARYSAFVLCNMNFLKLSHSKSTINSFNFRSVSLWTKSVSWEHLEIIRTINGDENQVEGFVEFKAYFVENLKLDCIHGKSRFIRQDNHWVYLNEL